ncbi:Ligand for members of the frizzled of seven transmembrane receptor [Desmophyllum pertusum]|uniref:Protein Wnt n=1 Tax=Desmophyllum pertusum TaxID=174260 RepID=A0A9X0CW12_9CNID|nr:Ligand for members of the frizzled of seven transmembrane receptor [Desmophyllum pertusum]
MLYGHHWPKPSSGEKSCSSIACLQTLAPFEVVASKLKQKFRDAVQVWFVDNKLQERVNNSFRPVSAEQLVYLDYSPSYRGCVRIKTVRYPGMLGRTSRGDDVNSDKYKSYAAPCSMCKLYPQTVQRREYPWAGSTKYIGPCQLYYQAVQRHLFRRKSGFEMVHPQKVNDSLWFNIVRQGAIRRGYFQCQKLFEDEAWTCPHSMYRTLPMFENTTRLDHYHHYHRLLSPPVNHKASRRPDETTRETAFIYAISAAAITHEVTLQCTQEKIPGCGCSKTRHRLGNWIVSACGDNVKFGMSETRRFLDKLENGNDARTAVNLHNNAVGREVVLRSQQGECLCRDHWSRPGEKFCSVENCPQALAPFEVVASNLKQKYHDAVQVWFVDNKLQERVNNSFTPVSAAQLVFLDSSPDYCVRNDTAGYPGVLGRTSHSNDVNSDKYKSFAALCRTCKLYPQTVQRLEYPRARGCRTLKYVQTTCIADKSEG